MSIFPPPSTRARVPADKRIRVEVYNRVLCIAAGRVAEREMREMLADKGLNLAEIDLFVNATEENSNG